jgi:hypothetical protein
MRGELLLLSLRYLLEDKTTVILAPSLIAAEYGMLGLSLLVPGLPNQRHLDL